MPSSLSELTPLIYDKELTHLGLKVSKYLARYKILNNRYDIYNQNPVYINLILLLMILLEATDPK